MTDLSATAIAHPNIAFIKYWGNCDDRLRLPANGSISMNLSGLQARTSVTFDWGLPEDRLKLNGRPISGAGLERVKAFLDDVRRLVINQIPDRSRFVLHARVTSENNFPTGAGIASSAAAFAALSLAASRAIGLTLNEAELSRLARRGSGSACRSIPAGFVEWQAGSCDDASSATSIAPPDHWDLVDCIAIVSPGHKPVGSSEGHALAGTSPLQAARLADTPRRLAACRRALLDRDFASLAEVIELDSHMMHAVMITSSPSLLYWAPATITVMQTVPQWRRDGLPAAFTVDAGPNVHVICPVEAADEVAARLAELPGVRRVLTAHPGGGAYLEN